MVIQALKESGFADGASVSEVGSSADVQQAQLDAFKVMTLIRAFMTHGHLEAKLDPLDLDRVFAEMDLGSKYAHPSKDLRRLIDYKFYGFTEADLDRQFYVDVPQLGGLLSQKKNWTLRELDETLRKAYCGTIGVDFMHIPLRD